MKTPKSISPFRLSSLLRSEKDPTLAFNLFKNPNPDPKPAGKPFRYSPLSYDLIITKLGRARMFDEMEQVLHQHKNDTRLVPQEIIFCNAMKFYGRACLHERALQLFEEMPAYRCQRTVKSVNSLLNALLLSEKFDEMKQVFFGMEKYARPDACTYNILIRACCLSGCLDDASNLFDEMQRKGVKPNVVTFGTLIRGLCMEMKVNEAFKLKADMVRLHGLCPNPCTYSMMIKGLCRIGELSLAIRLKEEMFKEAAFILDEMIFKGYVPHCASIHKFVSGLCQKADKKLLLMVLNSLAKGNAIDQDTWLMVISKVYQEDKLSISSDILDALML
ncbi:hypothetical protein POUND7_007259 [Theobroma cacao]